MPEININQARNLVELASQNQGNIKKLTQEERVALNVIMQEAWGSSPHEQFWIKGTTIENLKSKLTSTEEVKESSTVIKIIKGVGNILGARVSSKDLLTNLKSSSIPLIRKQVALIAEIKTTQAEIKTTQNEIDKTQQAITELNEKLKNSPTPGTRFQLKDALDQLNDALKKNLNDLGALEIKISCAQHELSVRAAMDTQIEIDNLRTKTPEQQTQELQDMKVTANGQAEEAVKVAQLSVINARLNELDTDKGYVDAFVRSIRHEVRSSTNIKGEISSLSKKFGKPENAHGATVSLIEQHMVRLRKELKTVEAQEKAQAKLANKAPKEPNSTLAGSIIRDNPLFSPSDPTRSVNLPPTGRPPKTGTSMPETKTQESDRASKLQAQVDANFGLIRLQLQRLPTMEDNVSYNTGMVERAEAVLKTVKELQGKDEETIRKACNSNDRLRSELTTYDSLSKPSLTIPIPNSTITRLEKSLARTKELLAEHVKERDYALSRIDTLTKQSEAWRIEINELQTPQPRREK